MYRILLLALGTVGVFGYCSEPISQAEMLKIVKKYGQKFDQGLRNDDLNLLVSIYSDRAKYLAEGGAIHIGKDEIRAAWKEAMTTLNALHLEPVTVDGNRDLIYETGRGKTGYLNQAGEQVWLTFKYVNIWKHQPDGSYLLDVDIYKFIN